MDSIEVLLNIRNVIYYKFQGVNTIRIWHEQLIPKLCRQHLLAMWRESLGAYKIVCEHMDGYSKHPAVKEFELAPGMLYHRLNKVRGEMLKRGYHPKEMPKFCYFRHETIKEWQNLQMQIEILKNKNCDCNI